MLEVNCFLQKACQFWWSCRQERLCWLAGSWVEKAMTGRRGQYSLEANKGRWWASLFFSDRRMPWVSSESACLNHYLGRARRVTLGLCWEERKQRSDCQFFYSYRVQPWTCETWVVGRDNPRGFSLDAREIWWMVKINFFFGLAYAYTLSRYSLTTMKPRQITPLVQKSGLIWQFISLSHDHLNGTELFASFFLAALFLAAYWVLTRKLVELLVAPTTFQSRTFTSA